MRQIIRIPEETESAEVRLAGRDVRLTNLGKIFFPRLGLTKRDLLQYYADVSHWLLPHVKDRAMVMKRYPEGAEGDHFYMKRAPRGHPDWLETCTIPHRRAGPVNYPVVQDIASLLWIVNLGCIDLNPWYSACGRYNQPDFLNFDLDPGPGASFGRVRETALRLRDRLDELGMPSYPKTSGSAGMHIYIPIEFGPYQKEVWHVAKRIAFTLAERHPALITAQYRKAKRPFGRVLIDYNQNAWGRTLASVYSVRPVPRASVSAPVSWEEIERGIRVEEFTISNMSERLGRVGDLWRAMLSRRRLDLGPHIEAA